MIEINAVLAVELSVELIQLITLDGLLALVAPRKIPELSVLLFQIAVNVAIQICAIKD